MTTRDGALEALARSNRTLVLGALHRDGPLRQADIARQSGLSTSTVSAIVAEARRAQLVREIDGEQVGAGRRGRFVALNHALGGFAAVAVGQCRTRVAVSDLDHRILAEGVVPNVCETDKPSAAFAIAAALSEVVREAGLDMDRLVGIGISMPSPAGEEHRSVRSRPAVPGWTGPKLAQALTGQLGVRTYLDNDANAAAQAELRWGAGRGLDNFVYVLAGSGIGAGLVVNGALYRGAAASAGEIAHVSVDPAGALCWCGSRGCLHTVASSDAIKLQLESFVGEASLREIAALGAAGDRAVCRVLRDAGLALGRVLAQVCNVLNPSHIIVGGPLAELSPLYLDAARDELRRGVIRPAAGVVVERSELLGGDRMRAVLGLVPLDFSVLAESRAIVAPAPEGKVSDEALPR
ncbi:ROK family transcriptional regulator [Micrococcales bacterium 31B]|nr:ROK family transcriptional regulator [Micrococcales bacterium 31B]